MEINTLKGDTVNPNTEYYEAHYQELFDQYPEQWVAIYNQEVVALARCEGKGSSTASYPKHGFDEAEAFGLLSNIDIWALIKEEVNL